METYKTTKTIRFKLEADDKNIPYIKEDVINIQTNNNDFNLTDFISDLNIYLENINNYLFVQKKDGIFSINEKMTIKNAWLKQYAKQEFVAIKERTNLESKRREQVKIGDIRELISKIEKVFDFVDQTYVSLIDNIYSELNERAKKAQIGLLLKRLASKNALPLLMDLMENTSDKEETTDLSIRIKSKSSTIRSQLQAAIQMFLPEQSSGLQIAKASFNYYTINKKPIDFKEKINKLEDSLHIKSMESINTFFNRKKGKQDFYLKKEIFDLLNTDIQNAFLEKQTSCLFLGEVPMIDKEYVSLRDILKNIKAKQKKLFNELMQNNSSHNDLKNSELYLFNKISKELFMDYLNKTEEMEEVGTELSNHHLREEDKKRLRSKKARVTKERGSIMKDNFKEWKSFADFYRIISQKHGKILAQLKGIEKEEVESQLLKYWALILEKENHHKLVLIPKEKAGECKQWIEKVNEITKLNNEHAKIFWFESLTYSSLQKLCFGFAENGNNEFNRNIRHLLPKDERGNPINGEFAFGGEEHKKIEFYKNVLQSEYAQQVLHIPIEQIKNEIILHTFNSLDDFQIALEKICYRRYVVCPPNLEDSLEHFKAQVFDITSLELRNSKKNNLKSHTQIWKDFWNSENEINSFNIRLNPEIAISYRVPKASRIEKYGAKSQNYDPEKKNRFLHPQFTLVTTISEHCNYPTKVLSFVNDDEYTKMVDSFNRKLQKENVKFAFGLDNGEDELSTLGVYLPEFEKATIEEKIAELKQSQKYGFEVITINDLNYKEADYNGKERKIIQNPSYFLKKENYMRTFNKSEQEYEDMFIKLFSKKHTLSLDLTTAKVICGHIVTNGDVPALFNLWLKHAQRNVFEMNDHTADETAKSIRLRNNEELTNNEKLKFAEYVSDIKKYEKLSVDEKTKYLKWIFEDRNNNQFTDEEQKTFNDKYLKKKGNYNSPIIFASRFEGDDLQDVTPIFDCRHVFKKKEEFDAIMPINDIVTLIDSFNTNRSNHNISNEELDLKITESKKALAANAVGVLDFLYKQYKHRFNGEGLIVKEGFDTQKVGEDIEKFSGNIYRILERKLYQKFQNYGLVPPIKSLMTVRSEGIKDNKNAILQLGNIAFIDPAGTSQECPVCKEKSKKKHTDNFDCQCGFYSKGIMHSNDGIAGYNIAKRGFENFKKEKQ